MSKNIISFIGRAGSGKDYQCNLLVEKGYKKVAFADALRNIAFASLGIPSLTGYKYYEDMKALPCISINIQDKNTLTSISEHKLTFRQYLEMLGTQGIRYYDENFWCKCLGSTILDTHYTNICISDLRFKNEYDYLYTFCKDHNFSFTCIFCDYKSSRYQDINNHQSAKLANWLVEQGYKDGQQITKDDIDKFTEYYLKEENK